MMSEDFIKMVYNPISFRMFMLKNLPNAYFSGVRVKSLSNEITAVTIPFKWFTKNPFRSTYFACLAMAAEFSTGLLAMGNVYKKKPAVSMLVIKIEAAFFKKATGITTFSCTDGAVFNKAVNEAISSGVPQTIVAESTDVTESGELVARFFVTWSFKAKVK